MANPEHVAKLNEGGEAWNEWRKANPFVKPDLTQADLRNANLWVILEQKHIGVDLRGADLSWANLYEARLPAADLWGADLRWVDLRSAGLRQANLSEYTPTVVL